MIDSFEIDGVFHQIRDSSLPECVNSVEECIDKTKRYILPDGHVYSWSEKISNNIIEPDMVMIDSSLQGNWFGVDSVVVGPIYGSFTLHIKGAHLIDSTTPTGDTGAVWISTDGNYSNTFQLEELLLVNESTNEYSVTIPNMGVVETISVKLSLQDVSDLSSIHVTLDAGDCWYLTDVRFVPSDYDSQLAELKENVDKSITGVNGKYVVDKSDKNVTLTFEDIKPIPVSSIAECQDTTQDYLLPDGYVYRYQAQYVMYDLSELCTPDEETHSFSITNWNPANTSLPYTFIISNTSLADREMEDGSHGAVYIEINGESRWITYDELSVYSDTGRYVFYLTEDYIESATVDSILIRLFVDESADLIQPTIQVQVREGSTFQKTDIRFFPGDEQAKDELKGEPGKNAYEYAQSAGYTGTEAEFSEKLAKDIPEKTSDLENDAGFIKNTATDLAYYYNKENSYSRAEIDNKISSIPKFSRKVVDALPEEGIEETLYLLRIAQPDEENSNMFEEWLWEEGRWERLGYQEINLVDYALISDVNSIVYQTLQYIYPVGAIYISAADTDPATIFKFGEWERIENKFLLAASDTYSAGTTGGSEKTVLTKANLPSINWNFAFHGISNSGGGIVASIGGDGTLTGDRHSKNRYRDGGTANDGATDAYIRLKFNNGGSSSSFTNMPPYLAVYVWKRVN